MQPAGIPFHRIVTPQAIEDLFAAFSRLLEETPAALLNAQGQPLHGDWKNEDGERAVQEALRAEPPGELFFDRDAVYYPLLLNERLMGLLAARQDSPALRAMRGSLALLLAEGLEKRELARETLDRYREINLVYHISDRIGAVLDADAILHISLSEAQRTIRADSGLVLLWEDDRRPGAAGREAPARVFHSGEEQVARAAQQELEHLWQGHPLPVFANSLSNFSERADRLSALLYAPILSGGAPLGLVCLVRGQGGAEFTAGDQKLLLAVASQASGAVEKARLHQRELERQRVEQELMIGERIQRSLLPRALPSLPGWDFAASYQSAGQVGGDFYDIFPLRQHPSEESDRLWAVSIADVTGKGIPAALMMAFSQAVLRSAAFTQSQPAEVLAQANRLILQNGRPGLLLTAFFAQLAPDSGVVRYANGGHEPPLFYRAVEGSCLELDCGQSTLLGAYPNRVFPDRSVALSPGDSLLLYTDGITEARSSSGAFFTEERLAAVLRDCGACTSAEILLSIQSAVRDFTAGEKQSDDMTMFVIKRL